MTGPASPPTPDFSQQKRDPRLVRAAIALTENRLDESEPLLRAYLKERPTDVAAIRMLAEIAARIGRLKDAEKLLRRALELSPGFNAARNNLAAVLYRQNRAEDAVTELDGLLTLDPDNFGSMALKAAAHGRIGDYEQALALYGRVLEQHPDHQKIWMSYGHLLKTIGRTDDSVAAYRRALAISPTLGEVWWSLANLKTVTFSDEDMAVMEAMLARDDLEPADRFHLHFALGKAQEDRKQAEASFAHYAKGNALRRAEIDYEADVTTQRVDAAIKTLTPKYFASRADQGCKTPDPIFILGMPRAGSTLIEQILASHSMVEGTMELPDIPAIAKRVGSGGHWIDKADTLVDPLLHTLGEQFIERTRIQRKTDKPFYIDKLPNNWEHIGLIRLILPNAKIIDARRHPLGSCFSNFKQHFARGQAFTYALEDIGRYYKDYVRLMAHMDRVQPGQIHRVIYERMVDDTETEIRALLDYLGLPFEEACLRFWETDRAVRTASSEQVRRPIFREGTEQWKMFEPWLDPLKAALGPVLNAYPDIPETY